MTRRNFLSFLASLPLVGRFIPTTVDDDVIFFRDLPLYSARYGLPDGTNEITVTHYPTRTLVFDYDEQCWRLV